MLRSLVSRIGALWRQLEHATEERSILVVMRISSGQDDMRVCGIQEGWRVLYATTVERAMYMRRTNRIDVILYDCDVVEADWRQGLAALLSSGDPAFAIVMSREVNASMCLEVIDSGGYALTAKPLDRENVVTLVNGALQMEETINSCRVPAQV